MNFILLTHQREFDKKTNTGSLVANVLADKVSIIAWSRTHVDTQILEWINKGNTALLYPVEESGPANSACNFENFIIIDGTWQEANKIFNRSPYLHQLPKIKITSEIKSVFNLRRNQKQGGLCTAECVIEILKVKGAVDLANNLQETFINHLHATK